MFFRFLKGMSADRRPAGNDRISGAADTVAAEALKQQGNDHLARGDLDAAANCYLEAVRLHPRYAEALNNLGFIRKEQERYVEAEAFLSRALEANPELGQAQFNLGIVAMRLGEIEKAQKCFETAMQLMPGNADACSFLANALHRQGKFEDACGALRQALALNPDDAEARWVLAMTRIPAVWTASQTPQAMREDFLAQLDELGKWFHSGRIGSGYLAVGSAQPFYLAYQEVSNKAVLARYGALCNRVMDHWPELGNYPPSRLAADGPIRVGIVTHMSNQSVWQPITRGWVQHIDRDRFDLHVFALDSGPGGEMNLVHASAKGVVEGKSSLAEWVEAILAQRIEVLIFPEIGMTTMPAKLANLRLAPIQAVAWGHPETSGLPTIDYFLSGECFEAPGAEENYTEKLVRLPNLGVFLPASNVAALDVDLADLGLEKDRPILLCPGAPFKYAPEFDHILVEIARRLETCRLVFFAEPRKRFMVEALRRRLEHVFERAGLDFDDKVSFVPFLERPQFYGLMRRADVFLDTIGFSGFNTALQAVECGLPIVTREGRFMRGRLASGILKRIGLPQLVANDEQEYISLAVRLATDKQYQDEIRGRLKASRHLPFDDIAPVKALEDFLVRLCRPAAGDDQTASRAAADKVRAEPDFWQS